MPEAAPTQAPLPVAMPEATEEARPTLSFGSFLWSSLVSVIALAVLAWFTFEPEAFRSMMAALNPWWLLAAVGTVAVRILFGAWRLQYVAHQRLTFGQALRGQLAWDFCSNVTPSVIGGAPLAAVYIARDTNQQVGQVSAFMLFAMLMDQVWFALTVPIVVVASVYMEVIPSSFGTIGTYSAMFYFLLMMSWTTFFGYATLFRPVLLRRMAGKLFALKPLRKFRSRVDREMEGLQTRARVLRSQPLRFYLVGSLLTLGTWIPRYLLPVFIVWSVFADLDALLVLMRTAALTLSSLILPTPGGSGGIEGLYFVFLGPPLMPKALVLPTLLTWRVLGYYLFLALGIFLTTHYFQKARRRKQVADEAGSTALSTTPVQAEVPAVLEET